MNAVSLLYILFSCSHSSACHLAVCSIKLSVHLMGMLPMTMNNLAVCGKIRTPVQCKAMPDNTHFIKLINDPVFWSTPFCMKSFGFLLENDLICYGWVWLDKLFKYSLSFFFCFSHTDWSFADFTFS